MAKRKRVDTRHTADYLAFVFDLQGAGLGALHEAAQETGDTKPLVDELAKRMPDRFPPGFAMVVIAMVPDGRAYMMRIRHPSFPRKRKGWTVPLRVPKAEAEATEPKRS